MLICYHRSSSIGSLSFCEMKYFCVYNLGLKDKENVKATLGTVTHRVMQVLADKKIAQEKKIGRVINDDIPNLSYKKCDDIPYVTKLCFDYYKSHSTIADKLGPKELRTCIDWVNKAVEYNDGDLDPRNQNVHATELFFDIEIKKPWAKYRYEVDGEVLEGNLSIKGTVDLVLRENDKYYHILDYKGLPINTPIPTPDGWSTMGDLKVGDTVFDQYGQQTKVTAKSTQKFKECYEITFDDTSTVVCDDEHYWKLDNGDVVQVEDLVVGHRINTAKPIDCEDKELPIDPYLLGLWLGDGRNRSCEITSGDSFVFDEIERRGYTLGVNQEKRKSNCESRTVKNTTGKLRELDLLHNKHIPNIYLRASYSQRLDLLRGLMDSDGSVNTVRKQCVFMNCRKELSEDVKSLLLTLGQRPLVSDVEAKGFGVTTRAYPVSFRPIDINPFLLPAKRDKVDKEWGPGFSDKRRIVNIQKIETKLTQCISVDSEDHTYLCTENLIPTHNTGRRYDWGTDTVKTPEKLQKDTQLLLYYYALRNMYPDKEFFVSIYYINDYKIDGQMVKGGLYSMVFDDEDYEKAENILRQKFEYIRSVELPRQLDPRHNHFKCKYLCEFSKPWQNSEESTCNFMHRMIQSQGIEKTIAEYGDVGKISKYGDGGGRLADDKDTIKTV